MGNFLKSLWGILTSDVSEFSYDKVDDKNRIYFLERDGYKYRYKGEVVPAIRVGDEKQLIYVLSDKSVSTVVLEEIERLRKEGLKVNAVYLDPKKTKKTHYHKIVTKFQPMSADIPKRLREINNRLK